MGLDQWLTKRPKTEPKDYREEVMYWRKANQIHAWFTEHCGGDNDEAEVPLEKLKEFVLTCEMVVKGLEKAQKETKRVVLSTTWKDGKETKQYGDIEIFKDVDEVEALLPPQSGFFFGSTEIGTFYYERIKETYDILNKELENYEEGDTYFYSSWW